MYIEMSQGMGTMNLYVIFDQDSFLWVISTWLSVGLHECLP